MQLATAIRAIARRLDPALPPPVIEPYAHIVDRALWRERLYERVLGVFAIVAVLLALAGLYGVITYLVAQRTAEFGMRMALGATRTRIIGAVLWRGARIAAIGVTVGTLGALAAGRLLESVLYGTQPNDATTIASVCVALAGAALLAIAVPAWRAASVDPITALRVD